MGSAKTSLAQSKCSTNGSSHCCPGTTLPQTDHLNTCHPLLAWMSHLQKFPFLFISLFLQLELGPQSPICKCMQVLYKSQGSMSLEKLGNPLPTGRLTSEQLPQDGSHKSAELIQATPYPTPWASLFIPATVGPG